MLLNWSNSQGLNALMNSAEFILPLTTDYVLSRGTGSATYTRATTATVTDHENIVRPVLSGEARFQGARRVRNLVSVVGAKSEDYSVGGWTKFGTSSVTGTNTINLPANSDRVYTTVSSVVTGDVYVVRAVLSGSGTVKFGFGTAANTLITVTLTSTPTTYSVTHTASGATGVFFLAYRDGTTATEVTANYAQIENVTGQSNQAPSEYVSVGVLSTPFHGAGVDGVKYFSTTNGNSVASNVVTEASGSTISASTLLGYLAEGARTNLCLQSNAFTTTWTNTAGLAATQNQTGPDGATSAWTMTGTGSNYCEQAITLTAATYTASIFVKKTTGATNFPVLECFASPLTGLCTIDTNNGVATIWTAKTGGWTIVTSSATCKSFGVNYWRVDLTFLATAASWTIRIMPCGATSATQSTGVPLGGTGTNVIYGAQLEAGSFASTYIPTTTASVVRNADVLTYPFAGNALDTAGSVYAEVSSFWTTAPTTPTTIVLFGSSGQVLGCAAEDTTIRMFDGTTVVSKTGLSGLSTGTRKRASSYGGLGQLITGEGLAAASGAFDGLMSSTAIGVGVNPDTSTAQWFGTIRNVRLYSSQLSASQLQAVTA